MTLIYLAAWCAVLATVGALVRWVWCRGPPGEDDMGCPYHINCPENCPNGELEWEPDMISIGPHATVQLDSEPHTKGVGIVISQHGVLIATLWFDDRKSADRAADAIKAALRDEAVAGAA